MGGRLPPDQPAAFLRPEWPTSPEYARTRMIVCMRHGQKEDFPLMWPAGNVALNHNMFMEVPAKLKIGLVKWRVH